MPDLPDVKLNRSLVQSARILIVMPQCGKHYLGTDVQSNADQVTRCNALSVIEIQLPTGQRYCLCEHHASELGLLMRAIAEAEKARERP